MTVTYTAEVVTCKGLGCFFKLLLRWKGSIYKLIWIDLLLFLGIYYVLNFSLHLSYLYCLNDKGKRILEAIVSYSYTHSNLIPLSFILGFFISIVMKRWWNQYEAIPFPDTLAVFVSANVHGHDERGRVIRRTIMRYVCLCVTMTFSMISPKVKKRFPSLEHLVEAGLLQESEKVILSELDKSSPKYSKHWLPILWAASIITRARKEGRIRDDFAMKTMLDELNRVRSQCGILLGYDSISVPLVYTQVVTLAVYFYFLSTLMAHQWIVGKDPDNIEVYFPFFTTLQFFFYVGWLKVAETLINPFGDDDDDFEVNWMVDRNIQMSFMIVDEIHQKHPELVRDQYWDEVFPQELPYTLAAEPYREEHPQPSTANISVSENDACLSQSPNIRSDISAGDEKSNLRLRSRGSHSSERTTNTDSRSRWNSLSRVASTARSFFSTREDNRFGSQEEVRTPSVTTPTSATMHSEGPENNFRRLTDDVIEELDEQGTLQPLQETPDIINSKDIFGPHTSSIDKDILETNAGVCPFESTSKEFKNLSFDSGDNSSYGQTKHFVFQ